jgi:hypothetical protein
MRYPLDAPRAAPCTWLPASAGHQDVLTGATRLEAVFQSNRHRRIFCTTA